MNGRKGNQSSHSNGSLMHVNKQLLHNESHVSCDERLSYRRLPNYQMSCFVNVCLQMMMSSSSFRTSFDSFCRDPVLRESSCCKPFVHFIDVYTLLLKRSKDLRNRQYMDSLFEKAYQRYRKSFHEQFPMGRCQDSSEFFLWFLNVLDGELNKYISFLGPYGTTNGIKSNMNDSVKITGDLLSVKIQKRIVCNDCGCCSSNLDKNRGINVSLSQFSNSLSLLLDEYFDAEPVTHCCEECGSVEATVYSKLAENPDTLLLTVKRWNNLGKKERAFLQVPFVLSLDSYIAPEDDLSQSIKVVSEISGPNIIPFKMFPSEEQLRVQKILNTVGKSSATEYPIDFPMFCDSFEVTEAPKTVAIRADGNCFFRSLSWWFHNGDAQFFKVIRKQIVEFVEQHHFDFEQLLSYQGNIQLHIEDMKVNTTWATQVEIAAAATYFDIDIYTFLTSKWIRYSPLRIDCGFSMSTIKNKSAIYLDNSQGNHFSPAIGKIQFSPCEDTAKYALQSVACHVGTSKYGHFTAFTFENSENSWYLWDDDKLNKMDKATVQLEAGYKGYLFLYSRSRINERAKENSWSLWDSNKLNKADKNGKKII